MTRPAASERNRSESLSVEVGRWQRLAAMGNAVRNAAITAGGEATTGGSHQLFEVESVLHRAAQVQRHGFAFDVHFDGELGIESDGGGIVEPGTVGRDAALLEPERRLHR